MSALIYLVRHGQTDWNAARRWQGHEDIPLNAEGIAQARALARRMGRWKIDALYSSDLARAAMTARIVGETAGLNPIYDPVWRERDVGAFSGLTNDEVRMKFPLAWESMQRGVVDPPGGETHIAFFERVSRAFERLIELHAQASVLLVSHGGVLSAVIAHVLGIGLDGHRRFSLGGNTGLSIIEAGETASRVLLLNDTCHLE